MSLNLNLLKRVAKKSPHDKYNHSSLIYSGSRLISFGYNHSNTHAEVHAIIKLFRLYRNKGIENRRYPNNLHLISFMQKRRSGNSGSSYPCSNCIEWIKRAGIRKVTYFNQQGQPCQMILKF